MGLQSLVKPGKLEKMCLEAALEGNLQGCLVGQHGAE